MPPATCAHLRGGRGVPQRTQGGHRGSVSRQSGLSDQYIVVVPKSKAVVTVQALDSKKFFDDVWSELVVPFLNKAERKKQQEQR